MPPLTGMGEGDERTPAYDWECSSCPVGKAIGCEMWVWDDNDKEIGGGNGNNNSANGPTTEANNGVEE